MTQRGRKPKPTRAKKLTGNPGHRRLNDREAAVDPCLPSCPAHLNKFAREEWARVALELYNAGLLSQIDRAALAAYCAAYGRWVDIEQKLTKSGPTCFGSAGSRVQHPNVRIANILRAQVVAFAAEFGMTPSSRSRVQADAHTPEAGLEEKLFGSQVKVSK
jgi:P27 family predicted phage terminase small subunit